MDTNGGVPKLISSFFLLSLKISLKFTFTPALKKTPYYPPLPSQGISQDIYEEGKQILGDTCLEAPWRRLANIIYALKQPFSYLRLRVGLLKSQFNRLFIKAFYFFVYFLMNARK